MPTYPGSDLRHAAGADAFGRARVASPYTLFDSKLLYDAAPLLWDDQQTSGTATTSHSTATASATIGVNATTAGQRVRQTFRRFNYQPGKSQLALITFVLDKTGGGTGITRRVGMFDANNGLFLEDAAGTYRFVRRTYTSGSAVDNATAQALWNLDPMDGTGPSGVTLDFSKAQILVIDYEWLGVGRVRMGFNVDGVTYYAHEMLHANSLASVYMSTPNLPIRYEITNSGTGAASTLECICASVMSEGNVEPTGVVRAKSTGGTHVDAATEDVIYALVGIKLKSTHLDATVELLDYAVQLHTASEKCEILLLWNTSVAGTFTYGNETNSCVQTATGTATSICTGGYLIGSSYIESGGVQGGSAGSARASVANALRLGSNIAGTPDTIVLALRPLAGSADVDAEASLTWRELT